jgi:DNA modification methylase
MTTTPRSPILHHHALLPLTHVTGDHAIPGMVIQTIPVGAITERIDARSLHPHGVAALVTKMQLLGFLPQFPVLVSPLAAGAYRLLDGAHRVEAATQAGLPAVVALVRAPCADFLEEVTIARASNEASGTMVPTTLIDDAELVWRLCKDYTQAEVGQALGWSRTEVANYAALQKIDAEAWQGIVTTFTTDPVIPGKKGVTEDVTPVTSPFTEGLLRAILDLMPPQQRELCTDLAAGTLTKNKFTATAKAYRARNDACAWLHQQLGAMDDDLLREGAVAIATGQYDTEWQMGNGPGPKLQKLVETLRDQWEKKYSIRLLHGDFTDLIPTIGDASIDAIVVDPPYNISTDRVYTLATQPDWKKDFGEWDHKDGAAFHTDIAHWATEYFRIMKPGSTGFMFVGEPFLNRAQSLFATAGFEIKGTFFWCRTNPGPSVTKADLMPAMDLAIQFVKPGASRTFHYPGDADGEGLNWQRFPICGGHERLLNAKKQTLHATQKPEAVIAYLMRLITVPGDVVFDGFMGTGTTARVAKNLGRKFVGFERDEGYFAAAQRRVEG